MEVIKCNYIRHRGYKQVRYICKISDHLIAMNSRDWTKW